MKKKLSADQMANVFINGLLEVINESYPVFAEIINDDNAFVKSPNIGEEQKRDFAMIVFAGNLNQLESTFEPEHADEVEANIIQKLSTCFGMERFEFKKKSNRSKVSSIRSTILQKS